MVCLILLALLWVTPAWGISAEIEYRGLFECFTPDQTAEKPVYCETSAVILAADQLYTASDKGIPGASSVMTLDQQGLEITRSGYVEVPQIKALRKAEDFALAPEGDRVFLSAAFDRVLADDTKWDAYNTLLTWIVGQEDGAIVMEPTGDPATSLSLRPRLQRALTTETFPAGAPYFKIEGLAMLPDHRLLFGVREIGQDYSHFDYTLQLVASAWDPSHPADLGNFTRIYTYTPEDYPLISVAAGLSSLAWDPFHEQLLILTSYELEETDRGLGAYLWVLSLGDLEQGNPPTLVTKPDGEPVLFAHKAEAVTVLSEDQLLVVHDDDRVLGDPQIEDPEREFYRQPQEAAYTLVRWLD